ncbi:MAG TPA: tetratricopeptide repeat protein [Candidatus Omnitrophota bacterium]|nr:tetratricopeptide repeat protein [Candidatus Omnitrophota bacterium]HNQ50555.1 tetratricopeptide repeat protein [Candidatus Omnitrophota bacterium]HQO37500.1 tetratricopeptide repeat protein [Candidatus Omnitrophota bacterium]HQQ06435.1 tetratricopeptide repeat protein [Candidatus Omnitrophota bacterium]
MSKHAFFPVLRKELDDAITYGTQKQALALARRGLRAAQDARAAAEAEYFRAQVQIIRGNFVTAIEHLDRAIALNPHDGAAFNDRALCMVEIGLIDGAMPFFDRGIAAEPDYATIYHNKGWLLNNIGRHTEAIGCFYTALELEPGRAVTYDNLADAQMNLGDNDGALASYRTVLALLKPGQCRGIRKQIVRRISELERRGT